ncbi:hypothetical protein [Streptomyces sp. NPDC003327]
MRLRRTTVVLLAALVTSGCTAVPHSPEPRPTAARPAALAPAGDRTAEPTTAPTTAPLTEAPAREELATTGPSPGTPMPSNRPARTGETGGHGAGAGQPDARRTPATARRGSATTAQAPVPSHRSVPAPVRTHRPTGGPVLPPEMRRLCRQAEAIGAPMGAAELCRRTYG